MLSVVSGLVEKPLEPGRSSPVSIEVEFDARGLREPQVRRRLPDRQHGIPGSRACGHRTSPGLANRLPGRSLAHGGYIIYGPVCTLCLREHLCANAQEEPPIPTPRHPGRDENPDAQCPSRHVAKEMRALVDTAWDQGWWCFKGKKHVICRDPAGETSIRVACTPSDHRTLQNTRAEFRRAGLKI